MEMAMRRYQGLKTVGLAAIAIACGTVLVNLQESRLTSLKNPETLTPEIVKRQAIAEKSSIELSKTLPAFGYNNLLADWAFFKFLQYFGDDARELGDFRLSADYFEIVIKQDPFFLEAYYYLSTSSSLYAGTPDRTIKIFAQGLSHMSPRKPDKGYYIWRLKAIDEHLFVGDIPAAIRSYLKAAEWASYYTDDQSKNVVLASQNSAEFLIRNPESIMAKVTAWTAVLGQARDQETRVRAIHELEKIGVIVTVNEKGAVNFKVPPAILEAEKSALNIQK